MNRTYRVKMVRDKADGSREECVETVTADYPSFAFVVARRNKASEGGWTPVAVEEATGEPPVEKAV